MEFCIGKGGNQFHQWDKMKTQSSIKESYIKKNLISQLYSLFHFCFIRPAKKTTGHKQASADLSGRVFFTQHCSAGRPSAS